MTCSSSAGLTVSFVRNVAGESRPLGVPRLSTSDVRHGRHDFQDTHLPLTL